MTITYLEWTTELAQVFGYTVIELDIEVIELTDIAGEF